MSRLSPSMAISLVALFVARFRGDTTLATAAAGSADRVPFSALADGAGLQGVATAVGGCEAAAFAVAS